MEDKRIKAVKQCPKSHSIRDIQVFLRFANFYRRFIQGFSQIAAPLTSILKTSGNNEGVVRVGGDSRGRRSGNKLDGSEIDHGEVGCGQVDDEVGNKCQKTFKFKKSFKSKKTVRSLDFLTPGARLAFTKLKQAFFKPSILHHFNPEYHIRIETDASGYAISGVFSQLTSDDLG